MDWLPSAAAPALGSALSATRLPVYFRCVPPSGILPRIPMPTRLLDRAACPAGMVPPGAKCNPEQDSWCVEGAVITVPLDKPPMLLAMQGRRAW